VSGHRFRGDLWSIRMGVDVLGLSTSSNGLDLTGGTGEVSFKGLTERAVCLSSGTFDVLPKGNVGCALLIPPVKLVDTFRTFPPAKAVVSEPSSGL
jgi:hypothetical protein